MGRISSRQPPPSANPFSKPLAMGWNGRGEREGGVLVLLMGGVGGSIDNDTLGLVSCRSVSEL